MRMRSSTGAATRAVRSDIDRKPANSAAIARERPRARGRARENHASVAKRAVISAGSHRTGSRSAARLSATPPIAATGIHKKKRRSSTSRVSARENAPRQSGAHAAARVQPAAAARAPVRAGVAIRGQPNASASAGERQPIGLGELRPLCIGWSWFGCLPGGGPDAYPVDLGLLGSWPSRCEGPR